MAKEFLTDEQVESEIGRLLDSDEVKLAKKEMRLRYRRRQYLYQLRTMEKRGKELMESGISLGNIEDMILAAELDSADEMKGDE